MGAAVGRLDTVVINVADIDRQATFWAAVLGVDVVSRVDDQFVWLAAQHPGGTQLALQTVPDPTPGPRRLHLDLGVSDRERAIRQVVDLGGVHVADHTVGSFTWTVMRDPEGNEFCLAVHD